MLSLVESILKSTGSGKEYFSLSKIYKTIGINIIASSKELYEVFNFDAAKKDVNPEVFNEIRTLIKNSDWPKTEYTILKGFLNTVTRETEYRPTSIEFTLGMKDPELSVLVDYAAALGGIILGMQQDFALNNPETKKYLKKYFNSDIQKIQWHERKNSLSVYVYLKTRNTGNILYDDGSTLTKLSSSNPFCLIKLQKK